MLLTLNRTSPGCASCLCAGGNVTVSGVVRGCTFLGVPGAVVRFGSGSGLSDYGTITADGSGNISGTIAVPHTFTTVHSSAVAGGSDPAAARFTASGDSTFVVSPGGAIGPTAWTLNFAAGYHCPNVALYYYPLATTLHATDAFDGFTYPIVFSGTLWAGGLNQFSTPPGIAIASCSPCTAGTFSVGITFNGIYTHKYYPDNSGCPNPAQGATTFSDSAGMTAASPTAYPPSLTATLTPTAGSKWYCGSTSAIGITE